MKPQTEIWIYRIVSLIFTIGSGYALYTAFKRLDAIACVAFSFCVAFSLAILSISVFRSDLFYERANKDK
jgi:hypothetical protein